MSGGLTLRLDPFGAEALRVYAHENASRIGEAISLAIRYYLADRDTEAPGRRVPPPFPEAGRPDSGVGVEVELDAESWRALNREARNQGVEPESLAEYACLHFLADLESGRLAKRLAESPGLTG
jgi:hypothetical protein